VRDTGARDGERLAGLPAGTLDIAYRLPEYQLAPSYVGVSPKKGHGLGEYAFGAAKL
jgi:hypothetical protein